MKMDDLAALMPTGPVTASPEVFQQLGAITRMLHDTLQQLGVMPKLQAAADGLPDARSRLNYIANKTAAAAEKVLDSVDQAKQEHQRIAAETRKLARRIDRRPGARGGLRCACSTSSATSKRAHARSTSTSPTSCWRRTSTTSPARWWPRW